MPLLQDQRLYRGEHGTCDVYTHIVCEIVMSGRNCCVCMFMSVLLGGGGGGGDGVAWWKRGGRSC